MLSLDKPRDTDTHTLADFAELLCLLTLGRICSREVILDQIRDVGQSTLSDNELEDCFSHFAWRVSAFDQFYPFSLDDGRRILSAPEELTDNQRLYVLLLLCANLPFIMSRRDYPALTNAFERISLLALKATWNVRASVKSFGKNETEYTGEKWVRINQLALDMGAIGACNERTFRDRDSGDGSIDLAAWLRLDAFESRNIPSALAQCACSRSDWRIKQTEISHSRLSYIQPTHNWMEVLFIPQSFRDGAGAWAYDGDVGRTVIYDRLRIVSSLTEGLDWVYLAPPALLDQFLQERLELV